MPGQASISVSGPDVDMLRKSVSGFAQHRIAPRAAAIDRDNVFPRDLWPKMGALGLHRDHG